MGNTQLISGTGAAVIVGFCAVIYSLIISKDPFSIRLIIFILGCFFTGLGLMFSRG